MPRFDLPTARWLLRCLLLTIACSLGSGLTSAQPLRSSDVPQPLRPWIGWVLDEPQDQGCRVIGSEQVCAWPGRLELAVDDEGARFEQTVVVQYPAQVVLPGSDEHWPQEVAAGGKRLLVIDGSQGPTVELLPGTHRIRGRLLWSRPPERLSIPSAAALVRLRVAGSEVRFPDRDGDALLLPPGGDTPALEVDAAAAPRPDSISLQVFRRMDDGVPLEVTTLAILEVSGQPREIMLDGFLLPGTRAVAVQSLLPTSLSPEGRVLTELHAGRHELRVTAVAPTPLESIVLPKHAPPWPARETWVWNPSPALRDVNVTGGAPVAPSLVGVPSEWSHLPAYRLQSGQAFGIATVRRGSPEPSSNQLTLDRTLWLDSDGHGWSVRDHITGTMNRDWRLDLLDGELGRVVEGASPGRITADSPEPLVVGGVDQLITENPANGLKGVEVRQGMVNITAEWRLDVPPGSVPAVGWSQDMDRVTLAVHTPPGWQTLHASGADRTTSGWLESWSPLDVLITTALAVAVASLVHPGWGGLMALMLVLAHGVSDFDWTKLIWIVLLVAIAVLRRVQSSWAKAVARHVRLGAGAVLVLALLQISANEIARALWHCDPNPIAPHAAHLRYPFGLTVEDRSRMAKPAPPALTEGQVGAKRGPDEPRLHMLADRNDRGMPVAQTAQQFGMIGAYRVQHEAPRPSEVEPDPAAVAQTGLGLPIWSRLSAQLAWDSRVERTHRVRLLLISPAISSSLALLRLLLVALLAWALLRSSRQLAIRVPPKRPRRSQGAAAALSGLVGLGAMAWSAPANAQPSPELLAELRERLTRDPVLVPNPQCEDRCVTVAILKGRIADGQLTLVAEVHAGGPAVYELPGPARTWTPAKVELDGLPTHALWLSENDWLYLRLDRGRHSVKLSGPLRNRDISLVLGQRPKRIEIAAEGWAVGGIDDGRSTGTLELTPLPAPGAVSSAEGDDPQKLASEAVLANLPLWLKITRSLDVGATWRVATRVELVSATHSRQRVRVSLLPGEHVTTRSVAVEAGQVWLELEADARTAGFDSVLDERAELVLRAPADRPWTEVWELRCGPTWQCSAAGIPAAQHYDRTLDWHQVYHPWPGEQLTLGFVRPAAADGPHVSIDEARLSLTPGDRQTDATLHLVVRSAAAGRQTIMFPKGTTLMDLSLNGRPVPVRQSEGIIDVGMLAGRHQISARFQVPDRVAPLVRAPEIRLGRPVANARVSIYLPGRRWPIWFGGATGGPTVALWLCIAVLAVGGLGVSRLRWTPLRPWQWVVLAVGLSQAPLWLALLAVGWPLLVHWRGVARPMHRWLHALMQLTIAGSALVLGAGCVWLAVNGLTRPPDPLVVGSAFDGAIDGWYVDRTDGALPRPWVVSASPWVWNVAALLWVFWLGWTFRRLAPWIWASVSAGGVWAPTSAAPLPSRPAVTAEPPAAG